MFGGHFTSRVHGPWHTVARRRQNERGQCPSAVAVAQTELLDKSRGQTPVPPEYTHSASQNRKERWSQAAPQAEEPAVLCLSDPRRSRSQLALNGNLRHGWKGAQEEWPRNRVRGAGALAGPRPRPAGIPHAAASFRSACSNRGQAFPSLGWKGAGRPVGERPRWRPDGGPWAVLSPKVLDEPQREVHPGGELEQMS